MQKRALILVDLQNEYLPTGKLPLEGIEAAAANAARAVEHARSVGMPVIHVRHEFPDDSVPFFTPGTSGVEIQAVVAPINSEVVITKTQINAFRDTALQQVLEEQGIEELVVVGAMSHMCIDAIVRAAVDMGYPTTVLHDACATLDLNFNGVSVPAAHVHAAAMAAFEFAYATVISTDEYL